MIAFSLFWWPVYWYWLFYLVTFVFGYALLYFLGKEQYFKKYPGVQTLLTTKYYYSEHLLEILRIDQWWMSFIGWVIGVTVWLLWLFWKLRLSKKEFLLLWDIILCIVPVWIFLGRIWNFLNQELWWKELWSLSEFWRNTFTSQWLVSVYPKVDSSLRVNTNIIESILEWFIPMILNWLLLGYIYIKETIRPWLISWVFLVLYWISRFFVEFFKDLPPEEMYSFFSISQWIMIIFFFGGLYLLFTSKE